MNEKFKVPFLYPQTIFKLTKMHREEKKAQKVLEDFQSKLLRDRRRVLKNDGIDGTKTGKIFLNQILCNEEKFTAEETRDHILSFLSGHETLGQQLAHGVLLLAMNSAVQEKLYDEIAMKIKSNDDLESSTNVNSIEYLDLVLKEIFRMMPVVPLILREAIVDFEMEPGLVIPKNTNFLINLYALQRQPSLWGDDADDFKPERFLPENFDKRIPFANIPFSAGPRMCIAYKFSTISLKIVLIKLLQKYRFKTSITKENIRLKSFITLKLCTKHLMTIEKRKK